MYQSVQNFYCKKQPGSLYFEHLNKMVKFIITNVLKVVKVVLK